MTLTERAGSMLVHRLTVALLVSTLAIAGALALSGTPAQAEVTHAYRCQISIGPSPAPSECNGVGNTLTRGQPSGVAIGDDGKVYIGDDLNKDVDIFDSLGNLTGQITNTAPGVPFSDPEGIAVDDANDLWISDVGPGLIDKFDVSGNLLAQGNGDELWTGQRIRSVAFSDASHHLYVADSEDGDLWVLNSDGSFNSDIKGAWGEGTRSITAAADNSGGTYDGDIYVSTANVGEFGGSSPVLGIHRIDGVGHPVNFASSAPYISGAQITGTPDGPFSHLGQVSVDPMGNIYALDAGISNVIDEFDSTGLFVGRISAAGTPTGSFQTVHSIAEDAAGDVYLTNSVGGGQGIVDVFGPAAVLAEVNATAAANVVSTTATLEGSVNPGGTSVTSCVLEYRVKGEATYSHTAPCSQTLPLTGSEPVAVSANVTGLTASTIYEYRLTASNANGSNHSLSQTFTTAPAVDSLTTGLAEGVTPTGATLTGSLSPDGSDAHYYFQYGTSVSYGSTSPAPPGSDAGTASESVAAQTTLTGLLANTTYHYRLVGVNSFGTTYGEDVTFQTAGPPAVGIESSSEVGSTHATLDAQVNPDGFETHYRFEYGTSAAYGTSAPIPDGEIASGFGGQPASAAVTGLQPNTTYHFRVVASSEGGTADGPDQIFTTLGPALVDSEAASTVTATSATLGAEINPLGTTSRVYFQYGTVSCTVSPASCTDLPLAPGTDIGGGESDQSTSVHLQGLISSTTYHFRVLVNNSLGDVEGLDQTFTTQAAGTEVTQPDGRAWELVSPPDKHGSGIIAIGNEQGADIQAAADGSAITYGAVAPFVADPSGSTSPEVTQVFSDRRAPGSWDTADITTAHNEGATPLAVGHSAEYKLFSDDLSAGLVEPNGDTPLPPLPAGSEKTVYLRMADGEYKALVTAGNVRAGVKFGGNGEGNGGVHVAGGTPDMSHVVLSARYRLTSTPTPQGASALLYEWSDGQLQPVSVLPQGAFINGSLGGTAASASRHTISDDGSRVIWSDGASLYLRDTKRAETVAVDAAQGAPAANPGTSHYATASSDGSKVFFTSSERLTANATVGSREEDLYVFEVTSGAGEPLAGRLTDLTVDANAGESAGVLNVIGASEDGSYVYFVAGGVLGDGGSHAVSGGRNLYVEHYDAGTGSWTPPSFVAALSDEDYPSWGNGQPDLKLMTSRVSPDGRYLAFMSERSLTGYENRDANSSAPDEEVFLYDASAGRLVCASCNTTGARPLGLHLGSSFDEHLIDYANNWDGRWLAGSIPGWTTTDLSTALSQSRYLSDSGRLFFNSSDALVPGDVNGKGDVYEYEPVGVGSCQAPSYGQSASVVFSESVGGCVALISAGTSSEESAFMGASESGSDVFFLTLSRLSSRDVDTSIDLYDAHECTASSPCAAHEALTPPPCTTGDACKAAPTPQPTIFGEPSSQTFSGAGNVVPSVVPKPKTTKSLTRAQKLSRALKACGKKSRGKRAACERQARKRYGPAKKKAKKSSSARTGR
jgi:hypothetical protein